MYPPSDRRSSFPCPSDLKDRQRQWAAAAEEQRLAAENADVPRGMRVMGDAEKAESIALLEASMADCREELSRFKLRVELPSQIRRHGESWDQTQGSRSERFSEASLALPSPYHAAELEAKMRKMEEALAVFRRPRVFVQLDA